MGILPEEGDVLLRTSGGQSVRLAAREIPRQGRASRGATLVKLEGSEKITGLAVFPPEA